MRLVSVADTHTFTEDLGVLPDGDVFLFAGDLLRAGTLDELRDAVGWIHELPHRHKIFVAGNHERCFQDKPEEARHLLGDDVRYLEDSGCEIDGLRFWGSPWQPAFNDWAFNLPRGAALAEKWDLIPNDTDILVTHGPPQGIGDASSVARRQGCEELRRAAFRTRPLLHVFGHIHEAGGVYVEDDITFANVTTWECERAPTVVDIDLATRRLSLVQVPARGP